MAMASGLWVGGLGRTLRSSLRSSWAFTPLCTGERSTFHVAFGKGTDGKAHGGAAGAGAGRREEANRKSELLILFWKKKIFSITQKNKMGYIVF